MGNKSNTLKRNLLLAGALVATAGVTFVAWDRLSTPADQPRLLLSGLSWPNGAVLSASLETRTGVVDLPAHSDKITIQAEINFPYRLDASVRLLRDQYRDFHFTVTDNRLSVVTDGFHAGDLVFLDINDRTVFGRVPSDWSGKLELDAALPPERNVNACVRIAGKSESFGLCHSLPERLAL